MEFFLFCPGAHELTLFKNSVKNFTRTVNYNIILSLSIKSHAFMLLKKRVFTT